MRERCVGGRHHAGPAEPLLDLTCRRGFAHLPRSCPMPTIGARCHELRVNNRHQTWRVIYRIDDDAIVLLDVFQKKTRAAPRRLIADCERRLRLYDQAAGR